MFSNEVSSLTHEQNSRFVFHEKEKNLIRLIREVKYGELRVIIQDGVPIRVEELKKSIKL